jgi:hypothetical protein
MKKYWIFCLILIGLVFVVEYDLAQRFSQKSLQAQTALIQTQASSVGEQSKIENNEIAEGPSLQEEILNENNFLGEAQKISRHNDPRVAERKIEELANKMSAADVQFLSQVINSPGKQRDDRAMAVELLSRKKTSESLQILNQFVAQKNNQKNEFDSVLKAQAIEGIASYPQKNLALSYLNSLADKVDESFLKDRISRSSENLEERPKANLQQQEEAALKQLIE